MSDKLSFLKVHYDWIANYYEDHIRESLKAYQLRIENILVDIIDEHASQYQLKHKGSVDEKKYYSVKTRVKSKKSLHEKLVRKNLGLKIIEKLGLSAVEDLKSSDNKALLTSQIKEIDDIIGARIVTELLNDNSNVFALLMDNKSTLKGKGIKLFESKQPQKMKNGLPIYRIKGLFEDEIYFELQIKSKIEEAWGEMDHSLFYKDYSFQPIKNTVALTMNNVGHLLEKIEKLLFDLRDSSRSYQDSAAHLDFLHNLNEQFTQKVVDKINIPCDLTGVASIFRSISLNLKFEYLNITDLALNEIVLEPNNSLCQSFRKSRNLSHELLFLELFFLSLKKELGETIEQNNYDQCVTELIEMVISDSKEKLIKNFEYPEDLIDIGFGLVIEIMPYVKPNILLDMKGHSDIIQLISKLNNLSDEIDSEFDDFDTMIKPLFLIAHLGGSTELYIQENNVDLDQLRTFIEFLSTSDDSKSYEVALNSLKETITP